MALIPSLLRSLFLGLALALLSVGCRGPQSVLPSIPEADLAAELRHQREAFLDADEARRNRLQAIAFPLLAVAAELFPKNTRPTLGVSALQADSLEEPYRTLAVERWNLGPAPQIRSVAPGSPAEGAGLAIGDCLLAAGSTNLETAADALHSLREALQAEPPIELRVRRGEREFTVTVEPVPLPPYRLALTYAPEVNAVATGSSIQINLGMVEFCEKEAELAFVFAHELAHNLLRHQRETALNYLLGTVADLTLIALHIPSANTLGLTAAYARSPAFELEADYVALYLLARVGYDLDPLRNFWRRMALRGPERKASKPTLWTHPDPAERQVRLNAAIDQIQERIAAGLPLLPESH